MQDEKRLIFIRSHERQEERLCCKAFQQPRASLSTEHALLFLKWEKFLPGLDGELTEQLLACSAPTKCTNSDENQKTNPYYGVWLVTSNGDMPPFIFSHRLKLNMEANIIPERGSASLNWEGASDKRTLHHATQTEELSFGCQKIFVTTSPQTTSHLIPQIVILWIIVCGTVEHEANKTPFNA